MAVAGHPHYWGLSILVMRCAQIAAILLDEGYLVSGAIEVGPVHHQTANIVGEGYQDAHSAQALIASPVIALAEKAEKMWAESGYRVGQSPMCASASIAFREIDKVSKCQKLIDRNVTIVNIFEPDYMQSAIGHRTKGLLVQPDDQWLRNQVLKIEHTIDSSRRRHSAGGPEASSSALSKWEWMDNHFRTQGRPNIEHHYTLLPELIQ